MDTLLQPRRHSSQPKISIRSLNKFYGDIHALDDVSLEVRQGEVLGLLGPNGAGKTTLMRIMTGYLGPSSGTVTVAGHDAADTIKVRQLIGYLPEFSPLYQDMMVLDYLRFVARMRGVKRRECSACVREIARICHLRPIMHRAVRELSRGYRQRVGIAHAMVGDPEILILDEPTSGLDPNQIAEVRSLVGQFASHKTVVLSTHILQEAERMCDRVVIISAGRIVADGTPDTLATAMTETHRIRLTLRNASQRQVEKELSHMSNVILLTVLRSAESTGRASDGIELELSCADDIGDEIYRIVKQKDWIIAGFTVERSSLEDVFREVTGSHLDGEETEL